jgi:hypothetical protein
VGTPTTTASTVVQSLQTILVVFRPQFFIRQDLVGRVNFLERMFVSALVGMMLYSELAIGFLDVALGSRFGNLYAQRKVQ